MYILENVIYKDIFDIFCNHNYNDENSNPKILINTLTKILTKNISSSIQSIKKELFTIKAEDFDSLKTYFNYTTYLQQRLNKANTTISDKFIQIILLGNVKKSYIQLYFNLIYNGYKSNYITIL